MRALRLTLISSCFILVTLLIGKGMLSYASASLMPEKATDTSKTNYEPVLHVGRGDIQTIAWQPNGSDLLISTARATWIYTPDLQEKAALDAAYATYNPDGGFIAGVISTQQVRLWNATNYDALDVLYSHDHPVMALAWSPAGDKIASLDTDGRIIIHSFGKNAQDVRLWLPDAKNIQWSKGGTYLAGQDKSGKVLVWKALSGEVIYKITKIIYTSSQYSNATNPIPLQHYLWRNDNEMLLWSADPADEFEQYSVTSQLTINKDLLGGIGGVVIDPLPIRTFQYGFNSDESQVVSYAIGSAVIGYQLDDGTFSFFQVKDLGPAFSGGMIAGFSRDGQYLAVSITNSITHELTIYDAKSQEIINTFLLKDNIVRLQWSWDAKWLITVGENGLVSRWNVENLMKLKYPPATANQPKTIWDDGHHFILRENTDYTPLKKVFAWQDDGELLASADGYNHTHLWDTTTGEHSATISGHIEPVTQLAWQPQGYLLASRTGDSRRYFDDFIRVIDSMVYIWDASDKHAPFQKARLDFLGEPVASLAWNSTGTQLAAISESGQLKIWDAATNNVILDAVLCYFYPLPDEEYNNCDSHQFFEIGWSPDNQWLYTFMENTRDNYINMTRFWNATDGSFLGGIAGGEYGTAESYDLTNIWQSAMWQVKGHYDRSLYAIEIQRYGFTNQTHVVLPGSILDPFPNIMTNALFSPDGSALVGQDSEHHAMVWSMPAGELRFDLLHAEEIIWSSDSTQLAVLNADEPIQILDAQTGKLLDTLQPYHNAADWWQSATQIFWSADSQQIAIIDAGVVTLWR